MSVHDEYFAAHGTEHLMDHFGDGGVVTVFSGQDAEIVADADAILGPLESFDVERNGLVRKQQGMRVGIRKDATNTVGLSKSLTDAYCVIGDSKFDVDRVESETASMIRLIVLRQTPRTIRRPGIYDQ